MTVVGDVALILGVLVVVVLGLGYTLLELAETHRRHRPTDPDPAGFVTALADRAGVEPELAPTLYDDGAVS